jgi:heterodisulfide reductase subunit A
MAKIGLYLCECGPNIGEAIDLKKIAELITQDKTVAKIEQHKLLCSEDGKKFLCESIQKNEFERIVIAACSPKQHESTFMEVLQSAGLNPYMMQLVNIREQCAWVTQDKDAATNKALTSIRAAINRVKHHDILEKKEIECNPDVIVIGGSIAGMETALQTAQPTRTVYLLEEDVLGGRLKDLKTIVPTMESAEEFLRAKINAVKDNPDIEILEKCQIDEILGFFGNFVCHIRTDKDEKRELKAGAVVLCLDAETFVPTGLSNFGYGVVDDVCTAAEFEASLSEKISTKAGTSPQSIAIVHCVGRKKLGYCSKMCCVNSMKLSREIKKRAADTRVVHFYKNLCLPGTTYEKFYEDTKNQNIEFIRFEKINVTRENSRIAITYTSAKNEEQSTPVDMVILSTGCVPSRKAQHYAQVFNIPVDEYGFLKQEHNILEPVSTVTEGVYITAGSYGPGDIGDALAQAGAAAGKVLSSLVPGKRLELEAKTSRVAESLCIGCGVCVDICAYGAVKLDLLKNISVVNEVLCRGCGNCAAACPSGAALHRHYTTIQISEEMTQILK